MEENIESKEKEVDNIESNTSNLFTPLLDILKDILKDNNLKEISDSFNEVKKEKIKADLKANQTNLTFWKWKFSKEFLIILIILISVLFLAFYDKIESSTVGTLLGSIIGYAIGNFNSKEKQN